MTSSARGKKGSGSAIKKGWASVVTLTDEAQDLLRHQQDTADEVKAMEAASAAAGNKKLMDWSNRLVRGGTEH